VSPLTVKSVKSPGFASRSSRPAHSRDANATQIPHALEFASRGTPGRDDRDAKAADFTRLTVTPLVSTQREQGEGVAPVEPILITPEQAAKALGIGRSTFYELLKADEGNPTEPRLVSVKIRGRRLVPVADLRAYVDELKRRQADG
jgi:excisionase family DNA binding protein